MIKRVVITVILLICSVSGWYALLPKPPVVYIPYSQAIYDQQHRLLRLTLATDEQYRLKLLLSDISPKMIKATLLQEDRYFYYHIGFNPVALIRAAFNSFIGGQRRYGASTISMQLARMQYGINTSSYRGKIKQIVRAVQIERHFTKSQILQAYFNLAPYGGNVSGVGAASLIYFSQDANQLSLPEAIHLSVIAQNPVKRKPSNKVNPNLIQAAHRLYKRWQNNYGVSLGDDAAFKLSTSMKTSKDLPFYAPHFVDAIIKKNSDIMTINTSLDLVLQQRLEANVREYIKQHRSEKVDNASVLLVDTNTMQVKSLIGSGDYFNKEIHGQINGAFIKRSPGSVLKPFIYALAIEQGLIIPESIVDDKPASFKEYSPENYDGLYFGPMTAQMALNTSRNIPAVMLNSQINPSLYELLQQASIRNLSKKNHYGLSIALGSAPLSMVELVQLYAMLENHGFYQPLNLFKQPRQFVPLQLLSAESSFITMDMLTQKPLPVGVSVVDKAGKPLPIAWKTGTSSGYHDAWIIGLFDHYVMAVWLGDFDAKANPSIVGQKIASPLFFKLLQTIQLYQPLSKSTGLSHEGLNLIRTKVCQFSGALASINCPLKVTTWFIPGVSSIKKESMYRKVAIDSRTGLRSCGVNQHVIYKVYPILPLDDVMYYQKRGVNFDSPPPFPPSCNNKSTISGNPPLIQLPVSGSVYKIDKHHQKIALLANDDSDVPILYWFDGQHFIGETANGKPLIWQAVKGKHRLRVMNNKQLIAETVITVH